MIRLIKIVNIKKSRKHRTCFGCYKQLPPKSAYELSTYINEDNIIYNLATCFDCVEFQRKNQDLVREAYDDSIGGFEEGFILDLKEERNV